MSYQGPQAFRRAVLEVSMDDLRRVGQTYLQPELASTAVISGSAMRERAADLCGQFDLALQEL